jgi:NADH dehydrogenase (ubiquinone) 1 beta subcomplex subunit 5
MVKQVRHGGGIGGPIENRPSRWNYEKFKDYLHFYIMLGAIPLGALIIASNLMVGQAVLKPIPEGYEPEEYEYYKSPITRWMVKNLYRGYQQRYEMTIADVWEKQRQNEMYFLMKEVRRVQSLNQDYKGWYTKENDAAMYLRMSMAGHREVITNSGND